jgi:hypothetical protein
MTAPGYSPGDYGTAEHLAAEAIEAAFAGPAGSTQPGCAAASSAASSALTCAM